jgi:hypothetical protein
MHGLQAQQKEGALAVLPLCCRKGDRCDSGRGGTSGGGGGTRTLSLCASASLLSLQGLSARSLCGRIRRLERAEAATHRQHVLRPQPLQGL